MVLFVQDDARLCIAERSALSTESRHRIFAAKSDLKDENGAVIANATGKYMPIKGEHSSDMLADVVPEPDTFQM